MKRNNKILDRIYALLILLTLAGVPLGIWGYDHVLWKERIPETDKQFTLTGNAQRGWLRNEVHAYDAVSMWKTPEGVPSPVVLEVSKGDMVVLKLKSSDVVHGFSLKDFGIFITKGIQPGKVTLVSFKADKAGTFTFSCNAICGDNHQNMVGTLVVKA